MSSLVIEHHYLPSVAYFTLLCSRPHVAFEAHEHYQKQTYRNRCYVLSAQRVERLSVPVINPHHKTISSQIEISYKENWPTIHWRTLVASYANAPFFEYYSDGIKAIIANKHQFLYQLNEELTLSIAKLIGLTLTHENTPQYVHQYNEPVLDARSRLEQGWPEIQFEPYQQVFGQNGFSPNLSIVDLLFNVGPHTKLILQQLAKSLKV